jgi:hypothetical protein
MGTCGNNIIRRNLAKHGNKWVHRGNDSTASYYSKFKPTRVKKHEMFG